MSEHSEQLDPTQATSLSFNRRAFARLAAGIAGGAATATQAFAQTLGSPHPPLVPETDPAIVIFKPALEYVDPGTNVRRSLDAYAAMPRAHGGAPCVVLAQAVWGVDAQLRDVVRRFAKAGYIAIAPNLYAGTNVPSGDGASDVNLFRPYLADLKDDVVDRDLRAAGTWAAVARGSAGGSRPKIAIVGFCNGGTIALRQTVDQSEFFSAAAVFYGKVRYGTSEGGPLLPFGIAYAQQIQMPLIGSWGARDTSIDAADVRELQRHLNAQHTANDIKVYDEAGHAFFDDTRPSYVPTAAEDSWTRVLSWFDMYLRT